MTSSPDPAEGGQAPFHVWERAVAEGFEPWAQTGSLRVVARPEVACLTPASAIVRRRGH